MESGEWNWRVAGAAAGVKVDGGGTLDGKTGTLTKWFFAGQTIKLPEAPTKEGFTFAGWETTVKGEKVVLQPGEEFTVTGAQSFTALWTEA